ncbi:unnamed protein product [Penicillium roqueforti FM164]|uniref:Uncharacterized protein n=1 Tax=Penicillium roqueforti (strain FM164) TaxID=1365484 RepID=W6R3W5_PENRF|nr:unnamed protein product [Penicillium roqueforti FM164]
MAILGHDGHDGHDGHLGHLGHLSCFETLSPRSNGSRLMSLRIAGELRVTCGWRFPEPQGGPTIVQEE